MVKENILLMNLILPLAMIKVSSTTIFLLHLLKLRPLMLFWSPFPRIVLYRKLIGSGRNKILKICRFIIYTGTPLPASDKSFIYSEESSEANFETI